MNYQNNYNSLSRQRAEKELQMYYAILNGQLINKRREELLYPVSNSDENVGGGRSNKFNRETENKAIKLLTDDELNEYNDIVEKVINVLQYLNSEEVEVIEAYYSVTNKSRHLRRSTIEVTGITNKDKEFCERVRRKVLTLLKTAP